jgi:predicted metalloenzyme YecM
MSVHTSSCALHNAPASEPGPCDCGAPDIQERLNDAVTQEHMPEHINQLLAECAITIGALRAKHQQLRAFTEKAAADFLARLDKYGHHLTHCDLAMNDGSACTCGFDQARRKE